MQEWWPFLGVFWALYLLDGLQAGRRDRIGFRALTGRRRAWGAQAAWQHAVVGPLGWAVLTEDLPCSLSADGLSNWPSGSAGRPPPLPDAVHTLRWEQVKTVETRHGWIVINGVRFSRETADWTAGELARLAAQLCALDTPARQARLLEWHRRRLRPLRVRRQLRCVLVRTRALACINALQTLVALVLTGYVLGALPERLPTDARDVFAKALPYLMVAYAAAHGWVVISWYRLHRRFWPGAGADRNGQLVTALLMPAQALQLRRGLVAPIGRGTHPLTVALAVGDEATLTRLARDTVADLRWPRSPAGLPPDARGVSTAAAAALTPLVGHAIRSARPRLDAATLLKPALATADACAFCPRCGDVFVRADALCPHGVPLQPLKRRA